MAKRSLKHVASFFLAALFALPVVASAEAPTPCVRAWGEARYGAYGYNHLVHLANACAADADCVVSTDVNPQPMSVEVPARSEVVVNTFLESPSRVFTPRVTCTMRGTK